MFEKSLDILQGFQDISIDVEFLEDISYGKIFTLRYLKYIIRYLKFWSTTIHRYARNARDH